MGEQIATDFHLSFAAAADGLKIWTSITGGGSRFTRSFFNVKGISTYLLFAKNKTSIDLQDINLEEFEGFLEKYKTQRKSKVNT